MKPKPLNSFSPTPIKYFSNKKSNKTKLDKIRNYIYTTISNRMDNKVNRIDCYRNSDIQDMIDLYDELVLGSCIKHAVFRDKKKSISMKVTGDISEISADYPGVPALTDMKKISRGIII